MDRRILIGTGMGLVAGAPAQAMAQGSAGSTRIADLEQRLAELEERVSVLEGMGDEGEESSPVAPDDGEVSDGITWEGTGNVLSDPFLLEEGRYRVTVQVSSTGDYTFFQLFVYGPNSYEDTVFNEMSEGGGDKELSTMMTLPQDGEYYFETGNTDGSPWLIAFEKL